MTAMRLVPWGRKATHMRGFEIKPETAKLSVAPVFPLQALSVPLSTCVSASQRSEEVDATGHQFAELSLVLSKGELPVLTDTQKNREKIAKHSSSINGDVGLPGLFFTVKAEEGCLKFG